MIGPSESAATNPPQELTIDQTVAIDFLKPARSRHQLAVELFARHRAGTVRLAIAPQGHRLDADGKLSQQIQQLIGDEAIVELPQLAYLSSQTYPSPTLFPGAFVPGFGEAWAQIIATWKTHEGRPPGNTDRMHVETHVFQARDVFLTDDGPLLVMCRRLRQEHGFEVEAMRLNEYMQARP
jgi:hypothetical protein